MRVNWVIEFSDAGRAASAWRVVSAGPIASVTGPISGPWPMVKLAVLADLDAEARRARDRQRAEAHP